MLSGPAAVTKGQRRSSVIFTFIANAMAMLLVVSILLWMKASTGVTVVVAGIAALIWIPSIIAAMKTSRLHSTAARKKREKRVEGILRKREIR